MKSRVPDGLRLAFLGRPDDRHALPLHAEWAEVRFFDVGGGWGDAVAEARRFRPQLTFCVLDGAFEASAVKELPGHRVGMVTRPPHGPAGAWDLRGWRRAALHAVTWFEPPPRGEEAPSAIIPLPVDRTHVRSPDFTRHRLVVSRWAAPPDWLLERLQLMEELVVLEPEGPLARHLEVLDTAGIFLSASYDAAGRLDPLPLHALARGLLVISTSPFPPLWGIEPEDDYLVRDEERLLATVDEAKRIPDPVRAVRLRAWQKVGEFFDADEVFKRLTFDMLLEFDAARVLSTATTRLRRVK